MLLAFCIDFPCSLSLGKSEVESQERLIDLTVENLKKLTVESKEDIKNKGNL